jgi:hypothetical protein
MLSLILRRIFFSLGKFFFLSVDLSRPFLSANSDFFKILDVSGTLKLITNFDFLMLTVRIRVRN